MYLAEGVAGIVGCGVMIDIDVREYLELELVGEGKEGHYDDACVTSVIIKE